MGPLNLSALADYKRQVNRLANASEFLMSRVTYFAVTTSENIKLQASSLTQLTQTTNQLTRNSLVRTNPGPITFFDDRLVPA